MSGKVKEILLQYAEVDESMITGEADLQNDLGLNSFDLMSIVVEFEDQFGIQINDEDIANLATVQDIEDTLKSMGISID